ncbi:MAG TPA: phosphotransferase [Bauldia sp.]|nr:phosphotransferase [Bauldia sp.]
MADEAAATREKHAIERAARLPIWKGKVAPARLPGGITNMNFTVDDAGERYVVRVGDDIPVHQILRFNEHAASRAAFAAGLSPEVVYTEPGIMVSRHIAGSTLTAVDVRDPARLTRIVPMLKRVHRDMPHHLRGPLLAFWVFHVIRDYAHTLAERGSRHAPRLPELVDTAESLELEVGPVDFVFGHNDLLPSNFIDDGKRIWLIDWDYAGWNSPLFDLSNLASNAEFPREQEERLLTAYYGRAPDARLWTSYTAMKCASLLREAMWSMVSEITSQLDFDYAAYTEDYLGRFIAADAARRQQRRG